MAVFQGSFSESVPFLKQPTNLDGSLPGDVGFDPLGFSEVFDVKVLREAELKHGRIAMLAVLGWIVQETAPASIHPGFPTVSLYICTPGFLVEEFTPLTTTVGIRGLSHGKSSVNV